MGRQVRMFGEKSELVFADIESYKNFFCVGFLTESVFEFHYLLENDEEETKVFKALSYIKKQHKLDIKAYNLKQDATRLKDHLNIQKPNKGGKSSITASYLDVDDEFIPEREDYYFYFNGLAYDIVMLDHVLTKIIDGKLQTTPSTLRKKSDQIINTRSYFDTKPYEYYANVVDVAKLDDSFMEKGKLTIGLKSLVGILGGQVKESESNKTGFSKNIYDDVLYNFNDIIELRDIVYKGSSVESMFINRSELLRTFEVLKKNGITVNDTTATFVENIVAPDKPIKDIPTVSFMFPAEHIAKERNIERFDVLEYFKDWYIENAYKPIRKVNPAIAKYQMSKILSVYNMYSEIRGTNWNSSQRHFKDFQIPAVTSEWKKSLNNRYAKYIQFVDKHGNLSSTYAKFSIGGIHGAEFDMKQFNKDKETIKYLRDKYKYISKIPSSEKLNQQLKNLIIKKSRTSLEGIPQRLVHEVPEFYAKTKEIDLILDPEDFSPFFIDKTGHEALHERYKYTSVAKVIHQDFDGYYPMLLCLLGAFYDGTGKDLYREIYDTRIKYKKMLKTLPYGSKEYKEIDFKQSILKLVCNSASGLLDTPFDNKARANNKAMAMRLIGQFNTFIIAQALAFEGAHIPSTNTDGIYVSNIDIELNKKIVDRELEKMLVTITPEEMLLISKDTNNRIEVDGDKIKASGGAVKNYAGATIKTRSVKPTLTDVITTKYLIQDNVVGQPFNRELAESLIYEYRDSVNKREFLKNVAWLFRPTSGSVFVIDNDDIQKGTMRGYITNNGSSVQRLVANNMNASETTDNLATQLADTDIFGTPEALKLAKDHDLLEHFKEKTITNELYKETVLNRKEKVSVPVLKTMKVANTTDTMRFTFDNHSIMRMSDEECDNIIENLNYQEYVRLVENNVNKWKAS